MKNIAKTLFMTLLAITISLNVFANNDTVWLKISPSKSTPNFIPANQGEPNIKYISKFIAIPSDADFEITSFLENEKITRNTYIEPAARLASDYDSNAFQPRENLNIYSKDEFFPSEIITSERIKMRDFDLLLISIAVEQYNPIRKITKSYQNIDVCISVKDKTNNNFEIYDNNLTELYKGIVENPEFFDDAVAFDVTEKRDGCNYIIVVPDDDDFKKWADSLRKFREEQGIITKVVSLKDIGSNDPDSLKSYFRHINESWSPAPEAILLFGDYSKLDLDKGITTYSFHDHPEGSAFEPYLSDNQLVDFNKDNISDIVIARMPAANADEARLMVEKTLSYERHPCTETPYYDYPITAMGYEKYRWFQLCSEILAGYWELNGKQCVHINSIHDGIPDSVWSTGQNTERVLDYFGPNGLGYIPETMSHLTDWDGNDSDITKSFENGTFMIAHRDHGTYETWGEPYYSTSCVNSLNNEELSFVISANCQTGHFGYGNENSDCLAERFLRVRNGAVAVIAASELSYSYVNDTYVWGLFDYLYPDFMPDYGSQNIDFQYPAFANLYGKLFLKKSSFPSNTDYIAITNRLFHYFGDAFLQLNTEIPKEISVNHLKTILPGQRFVTVEADEGATIALSVDSQLIAKGKAANGRVTLHLAPLSNGTIIKVVATKQNHFRHESYIRVTDNHEIGDNGTEFQFYPNPFADNIRISGKNIKSIKIINALGVMVKEFEFPYSSNADINMSDLSDGVYLVLVNDYFSWKIQKTKK